MPAPAFPPRLCADSGAVRSTGARSGLQVRGPGLICGGHSLILGVFVCSGAIGKPPGPPQERCWPAPCPAGAGLAGVRGFASLRRGRRC